MAAREAEAALDEQTPLLQSTSNAEDTLGRDTVGETASPGDQHTGSEVDDDTPAEPLSALKFRVILGCLWVNAFLAALDATVVATLSAPISASFSSGTSFSWIATGYSISNAAFQPISGKMTDIYGRRAGVIFSMFFFGLGTLLCGMAPSVGTLIAGRIVAGMGGGLINTVGVTILSDLVSLRQRGVYQGLTNLIFGAGIAIGGVYGGFVSEKLGWRAAFYIQVPFIAIAGVLSGSLVNIPVQKSDKSRLRRVDFLGAITLVSSLILLLLGLNAGGNTLPWTHPLVLTCLPLGAVLFGAFIVVEQRVASEPIIPLHLMANRTIFASSLTLWFHMVGLMATMYYSPVLFQVARGKTAAQSGIQFVPQAACSAIGSLAAGLMMRWTGRYWRMAVLSQALAVIGSALFLAFSSHDNVSDWALYAFLSMISIGGASVVTITLVAMISALDFEWQAVVTSISYAFRSTGTVLGITLAGTIYQNLLQARLEDLYAGRPGAAEEVRKIRDSVDYLRELPIEWRVQVVDRFVDALRGVWTMALGSMVVALVCVALIRENTLHGTVQRK